MFTSLQPTLIRKLQESYLPIFLLMTTSIYNNQWKPIRFIGIFWVFPCMMKCYGKLIVPVSQWGLAKPINNIINNINNNNNNNNNNKLTNSMAYATRRINAAFTRALQ